MTKQQMKKEEEDLVEAEARRDLDDEVEAEARKNQALERAAFCPHCHGPCREG